jgi:hypothetical protein
LKCSATVCEELGRNWISIEERRDYAALSIIRFISDDDPDSTVTDLIAKAENTLVDISKQRGQITLV